MEIIQSSVRRTSERDGNRRKPSLRPLLLLALMFCLLGGQKAYAQNQSVSLPSGSLTIAKFFNTLEKQTGYLLVYSDVDLNVNSTVSFPKTKGTMGYFLDNFVKGRDIKYEITPNKYIVFSKASAQAQATAQTGKSKLSGTVTDPDGEPLIGATVTQKGTQNKVVTDIDGNFTIEAPVGSPLVISYIGSEDREVRGDHNMSVTLKDDTKSLEEVVVVGYGTMKKKNLTGAVSAIDASTISDSHATNLANALQGAAAGLTINRSDGAPEGNSTLLIRGVTTISDSSPLVIIDGVPGDMSMVNPDDVDNVSVLKDAASAAIYGSRAAAGVILITTKRAKSSDLSLSYNMEFAYDSPTSTPGYVGWKRFMEMTNELRYNDNPDGGKNQTYPQDLIDNYLTYNAQNPDQYPITNWEDYLYKSHTNRQSHAINLMGGGKVVRSKASFRYDKNDGMYANRNYERYMTRINNDFEFNKYIEAHLDANFTFTKSNTPHNNPYADGARNIPPIYAVYWSDGRYGDVKDGENIVAKIREGGFVRTNRYNIGGKGEINVKPIDGLKLSAIVSPNFSFTKIKDFTKQIPYTNAGDPNKIMGYMGGFYTTQLKEERNDAYNITTQFLANYEKSFGSHNIAAMAGYEYYYMKEETMSGSGNNYELTEYPYLDLSPNDFRDTGGNALEYSYRSYFGRINYSYAHKYLLEFDLRRDGSSRFAKDTRWVTFPSASAGWVVSEENFMKNIGWLDYLKLRASYGKLGNERIGSYYPYQASIDFGTALMMNNGVPVTVTTAAQGKYAVRNISWETTETWDIGLDARFLRNRLGLSFDYYRKNTKGMLLALQIPIFMGYENPDVNAGTMHTNGFDLELSWRDHIGELNYSVAFNLTDYKSVMGNLNGTEFVGEQINREGSEYNQWYGYLCDGIYQTQEEVDNSAKLNQNIKVGDLKYRDISGPDGKPDGIISPEYDRTLLKGSLPRFLYGMSLNAAYRGFDFSMSFQGVGQRWVRKTTAMVEGLANNWTTFPDIIDGKYWSSYNTDEQNAAAIYPRLSRSARDANYAMSDHWLFNGWYLRCKNITLGYTLPSSWVSKAFVKSLRVYVAANDLFCFNNHPKGWDPEVSDAGYPIMRSLMFGLNVNF
ncbi:TonB-dependent receptor [Prevotella sp. KH2C16]|uniref:SusC/RagA family TonB-linked outer membrane protein n=1 Tax=Prevotella sp. KH2C16 TaxID=1855325 RepID=UPI0008E3773F|nr:TonB-dependent receptor [Prevotella sp. KH2C16]SFF82455.1 TonB-linked outer membrane protein, SusC/RagA family [Prevotella sp. KH2C16]